MWSLRGPKTVDLATQVFERLRVAKKFEYQCIEEIAGLQRRIYVLLTQFDIIYAYEENAGCMDWLCTIIALFIFCDALDILFVHIRANLTYLNE